MYEYLFADTILGIIWIVMFFNRPDLRKQIKFGGIVALLFGITEPLFIPRYYHPYSVLAFQVFNLNFVIESIFFLFFGGGISAVVYEEFFCKHVVKQKAKNPSKNFYTIMILLIASIIFFGIFMKLEWIHSLIISGIITGTLISIMRSDLIKEMIFSGISFFIIYFGMLLIMNIFIFPNFASGVWTVYNMGIYVAGVPIEEGLYALLFGIVWSPLYEIFRGYKLR